MNSNLPSNTRKAFQDYVIANPAAKPVSYAEANEATGGGLLPVSASELVGKQFTIYQAKPFNSAFEGGGAAYFCTIRVTGEEELKTVVIGGKVCVDFLMAYARSGFTNPVLVTLAMSAPEPGKNSYYIFE